MLAESTGRRPNPLQIARALTSLWCRVGLVKLRSMGNILQHSAKLRRIVQTPQGSKMGTPAGAPSGSPFGSPERNLGSQSIRNRESSCIRTGGNRTRTRPGTHWL
jgi:hypothetical protein